VKLEGEMELVFSGRITPERATFSGPEWEVHSDSPLGFSFHSKISIFANQISVLVSDIKGEFDIYTLRNAVLSNVRSFVDLFGFKFGVTHDVDIISVLYTENGSVIVFGTDTPVIRKRREAESFEITEKLLVNIDAAAIHALGDYREARKDPIATPFHCYRATEALMQTFREEGMSKAAAWARLRNALRIDESVTRGLESKAAAARHGELFNITDAEREKLLIATDDVLGRYLRFLEAGRQDISADKPLLTWPQ
jgi:hypothetical protein